MTSVLLQSFEGANYRVAAKPVAKRLLSVARVNVSLSRDAPTRTTERKSSRIEPLALVLVAVALHLLIVWAVWQRGDTPRSIAAPQEIELVRPTPEVKPEPPKPAPPPPKAVEPPRQTPPPVALRTAPATTEVAQTDAVSIPENLQAQKTTGPVVAAPAAPPAPKAEEPVTEANAFAGYLNNPPPVYPKAAQRQGLQGRVLLRVYVLASGQVGNVELKQSSGKPVLDDAALTAVRGWTFAPAKKGRTAIDGWTTVPIDFKLAS